MIDWDFAVATGSKLAGRGPTISREDGQAIVAELRAGAARSTGLVGEFTGLIAPEGTAPVLVVDRPGWIQANADVFAGMITPVIDRIESRRGPATGMTRSVGSKVTGLEIGTLLGFLSSKVLGQFDPFHQGGAGAEQGRLLLVAPNIVHAERQLDVDPHDFRLWVCLHEETHRVQFTAVPWMAGHIRGEIEGLLESVNTDPSALGDLFGEAVARMRGDRSEADGSILDLFSSAEQREAIERVTAVMSLLEGHADVVMDGVGPRVIPSVKRIRKRFEQRRKGAGPVDRVLRRLLGLEAKMAQYRDGAAFVRGVVDQVGMAGFNRVWERAEHLPSPTEIADPRAWVTRVHGPAAS